MTESTPVSLNFQSPNISTVVYAVQNDKLSRHIVAQLRDGSATWTPPAGALAAIRYLKPDGTGGFYDVDENNDPAISVSGSVATLTLAEQCTTIPGDVYMQLNFYGTDGSKLTTFCWILRVQKSVLADATIISSDYYNVLTAAVAQVAADRAAVEEIAAEFTFPVGVPYGGTGANNAGAARENLDAMGNRYAAGDTVDLGGVVLVGSKLSSGAMICSIMLPKIVPSSLTITHNLTVAWVRGNGIGDSAGLAVSRVTRASSNVLQIAITGSTIPALYAAVINISAGNISFS